MYTTQAISLETRVVLAFTALVLLGIWIYGSKISTPLESSLIDRAAEKGLDSSGSDLSSNPKNGDCIEERKVWQDNNLAFLTEQCTECKNVFMQEDSVNSMSFILLCSKIAHLMFHLSLIARDAIYYAINSFFYKLEWDSLGSFR